MIACARHVFSRPSLLSCFFPVQISCICCSATLVQKFPAASPTPPRSFWQPSLTNLPPLSCGTEAPHKLTTPTGPLHLKNSRGQTWSNPLVSGDKIVKTDHSKLLQTSGQPDDPKSGANLLNHCWRCVMKTKRNQHYDMSKTNHVYWYLMKNTLWRKHVDRWQCLQH